jgi:hypothetical protein
LSTGERGQRHVDQGRDEAQERRHLTEYLITIQGEEAVWAARTDDDEAGEKMGGYHLVGSDDLDGLLEIVGALTRAEAVVEVRPVLGLTPSVPS